MYVAFSNAFNLVAGGGVVLALIAVAMVVVRYGREAKMAAVAADEELVEFPVEPAPVGSA